MCRKVQSSLKKIYINNKLPEYTRHSFLTLECFIDTLKLAYFSPTKKKNDLARVVPDRSNGKKLH